MTDEQVLDRVDVDTDDGDDESGNEESNEESEADEYEEFDDLTCAERVLDMCLRAIVDEPDEIEIESIGDDERVELHVRVASDDMGKIIGKRGRVANALRTVVKAAGARDDQIVSVEIDD